jgi:hypothetical protein
MASQKLTELIKSNSIEGKDLMYFVEDVTQESKSIDASTLFSYIEKEINILDPFILNVSPGGSTNYTNDKSKIYLKWSGGSGIHNLILPSAAINKRQIQIISNGTLSANNKVHILAPEGESIDGVPNPGFYTLNKSYNGVTVWSDGSEWIIIQAKST